MKRKLITALLGLIVLSLVNLCWYTFAGSNRSVEKLAAGKELSLYECCSIYQLHLTMSICGFPISPEASRECLKLHFRQTDTVVFTRFNFRRSERLSLCIDQLLQLPEGTSARVSWDGNKDYSPFSPEHRAAIALNPCTVTLVGCDGNGILFRLTVSTRYPEVSRTEFDFKLFKLVINEGLFRYLQDKGWLSEYTAVYEMHL